MRATFLSSPIEQRFVRQTRKQCTDRRGQADTRRLAQVIPKAAAFIRNTLGVLEGVAEPLATLEHAFTHFDLTITPLLVRCEGRRAPLVEEGGGLWYNLHEPARIGLPAPVSALLARLADETLFDRRP